MKQEKTAVQAARCVGALSALVQFAEFGYVPSNEAIESCRKVIADYEQARVDDMMDVLAEAWRGDQQGYLAACGITLRNTGREQYITDDMREAMAIAEAPVDPQEGF